MDRVQFDLLSARVCEKLESLVHRLDVAGDYDALTYGEGDVPSMPRYIWRPPDVVVFREVSDFYGLFEGVEELDEWIGLSRIVAPVVNIYLLDVTDRDELENHLIEGSLSQETPDGVLTCFVLLDEEKEIWSTDVDWINGNVIVQEEPNAIEILEKLLPAIDDHVRGYNIEDPKESELLLDVSNMLGSELFHLNEVISAYRNDKTGILVVLLSVSFESYLRQLIAREYPKTGIGKKANRDEHVHFKNMIDFCLARGELTADQAGLIDDIRDERNSYAHELDSYHIRNSPTESRSTLIEDAVDLYKDLNGIDRPILE